VDHAGGMDGAQGFRQARRQPQHFIDGQRSAAVDRLGQRRPSDILGSQPRHPTVRIRIDHPRGKQATYLAGRGDLFPEPGPELAIRSQFCADEFHGDGEPVRRKAQEHPSHAAAAQPPGQAVRPDRVRVVWPQWRYHPDPHPKRQVSRLTALLGNAI
jgi:hypothetical protein